MFQKNNAAENANAKTNTDAHGPVSGGEATELNVANAGALWRENRVPGGPAEVVVEELPRTCRTLEDHLGTAPS